MCSLPSFAVSKIIFMPVLPKVKGYIVMCKTGRGGTKLIFKCFKPLNTKSDKYSLACETHWE